MPCKEFNPQVCDTYTTRATVCASSQKGYIAASVTVNTNCSFQYTVYLEQWNQVAGVWMNIAERNGLASTSGTHHTFEPKFTTVQTFRVRCEVRASKLSASTASFTHV